MDNKKVVSLVDEFDFWEEEILKRIAREENINIAGGEFAPEEEDKVE